MDNYIVSARKYRPSTFQSVVGQKSLTTTLKNAIMNNKLAHAYLFCGPRGVGKTTCARIFAKTINCLNPTADGEACNVCESCVSFNEQRSYNIHELDAASNNSVDDIRSLIEQVRIPPQIGKYKVYIIDEVHMLSSAAFNAFLKTLEEPPHHAVFVLATTEKHKILPTILSRCQIYDFSRISINDTVEHLQYVAKMENVTAEPEALNIIAQKADGGMRDALSIFDQVVSYTGGNVTYQAVIDNLNVLDYEYYFKLTDAILIGNVAGSLLILNEILNKGFEGQHIISGLASHLRDLMVCKDEQTIVLFEVGDVVKQKYLDFSGRCTNDFLYKALEWTNDCDLNYRQSKNKRLLMEILLIRLCQLNTSPAQAQDDKKKITLNSISSPEKKTENTLSVDKKNIDEKESSVKSSSSSQNPLLPSTEEKESQIPKIPVIRKRPGLSLKTSQEEEKKQVAHSQVEQSKEPNQQSTYTQEDLNAYWIECADQYINTNVRLQVIMRNAILQETQNKDFFEVSVYNQEEEQLLNTHISGIVNFLRLKLKNSEIEMTVRIDKENKKQLAYTDKEKYQQMSDKNPNLAALVREFRLKLD